MEKFIADNPGLAFWLLGILVMIVLWLWKRDVKNTNSLIMVSLENNTKAMEKISDCLDDHSVRIRETEKKVVEIDGKVDADKEFFKQQMKFFQMNGS